MERSNPVIRSRAVVVLALLYVGAGNSVLGFSPSVRWMGDVRMRSEVDMRDFNLQTPGNTYTLLRVRLAVEATPTENLALFFQARDSRVVGQEKDATGAFSTLADTRNLDLHQGYVDIRNLFLEGLSLRVGRQELAYGNERMVGPVGWHNVGRVFDGGLLRFRSETATLDLLAMNTGEMQSYAPSATPSTVASTRDEGQDFYGSYVSIRNVRDHSIDGYVLYQWNRQQPTPGTSELSRYSVGSYVKGSVEFIDYEAEVGYQGGRRRGIDVSAYMLTGGVGYSFQDMPLKRILLGMEFLSGTRTGATTYNTFDPIYATGHKFYGFMDYFINIPAQTGDRGLLNWIMRGTLAAGKDVTVNLWLHHFSLHREDKGELMLGQEIDGVVLYKYSQNLNFELGASAFVPGPVMRSRFAGSDAAFWGYLAILASF